jgi:hypothetical protein
MKKRTWWKMGLVFLVPAFLAFSGGTGVGLAAQENKAVPAGGQKKAFDAHDTGVRFHFNDTDMDFHFGTIVLGSTVNHGAEIGEAFYAASRIKDGDAASWHEEWFQLARRVEARGEASLAAGHRVSARDQFHRAAYYYRISLISMLPTDPHFKERARKSRRLVKSGSTL